MSRLEEIKARLAAATPGPWHNDCSLSYRAVRAGRRGELGDVASALNAFDATLIANAPADLALLVEAIERLTLPHSRCADYTCATCDWLHERGLLPRSEP